jgi:hypothetical protein
VGEKRQTIIFAGKMEINTFTFMRVPRQCPLVLLVEVG